MSARGTAIPPVTTDQMREVDRLMVETYGISILQMMEHAGRHLADLARMLLGGSVLTKSVAVAAGRGNNGGGGLVAARHLSNWGAKVTALVEAETSFADVPAHQWKILGMLPVDRKAGAAALVFLGEHPPDLVLDALIGYGLRGHPQGWTADMIRRINAQSAPVLALDVPSGLDGTTGEASPSCIEAAATMTLALPKTGLVRPEAKRHVGTLYLADIGVPPALYRALGLDVGPLFVDGGLMRLDPLLEGA